MKKKMIILVISLCFLVGAMFFVIRTKKPFEKEMAMNIEYIYNNYDLDLFEERVDNKLELSIKGKYIGKDEIITNPEITLYVNCLYVYTDADEQFTDMFENTIVLKQDNEFLRGELSFDLKPVVIDGYSCSYNIENTTGSYIVK